MHVASKGGGGACQEFLDEAAPPPSSLLPLHPNLKNDAACLLFILLFINTTMV